MGGPRGPLPKDPRLRQRTNKVSTAAELPPERTGKKGDDEGPLATRAPGIPKAYDWLPETRRWWSALWHSPMVAELIGMDHFPLYRLGHLVDELHRLRAQLTAQKELRGAQDEVIKELRSRPIGDVFLELGKAVELRARLNDQLLKIQTQVLKQEAEIRAHEQRFGLTPLDRRRLQWAVGRSSTKAPKVPKAPTPASQEDPRRKLALVK